ncbi:hypothetical protein GGE65_007324 [Skermanella aerolata]|jgi:hypothetical protein|uniref:DUF411 domain-containing protein n=1 Tax=Skermanella aerolata TaxID=393310 RepID=UPI003D1EB31B
MRILKTLALTPPASALAATATLYKSLQCGCCEGHAKPLRASGVNVKSIATHNFSLKQEKQGVPADFVGCHMTLIDSYVVEGRVSAVAVKRLLVDLPAVKGISLPETPVGSTDMEGPTSEPLVTYAFDGNNEPQLFAVE